MKQPPPNLPEIGPPLKPRPRLLGITCIAFVLWVGLLVVTYFTVVR